MEFLLTVEVGFFFLKINKRGGSNKACSWKNCLKKNKKNSMLIRDFRVVVNLQYWSFSIFLPIDGKDEGWDKDS